MAEPGDPTDPYAADAVVREEAPGPQSAAPGASTGRGHRILLVDAELPAADPVPELGTRPLFPLHPVLSRALAVALAFTGLQALGLADPDLATALGNLAFRAPVLGVITPGAVVLAVLCWTTWRRRHAAAQEAVDRLLVLAIALATIAGAAQALLAEAGAPGLLAVWAAALTLPLQALRHPRTERAWLLEEMRWYWLRGFLVPVLGLGLALPGLAGWTGLSVAWSAADRMDRIEALLADAGEQGCRVLEDPASADELGRIPVLLFGPRDGSLGRSLARCVERAVRLDDPVAVRLRQTAGDDLTRPLDGTRINQQVIADTLAVRKRLRRRLAGVVGALDPQGRERYGRDLVELAERTGVCENPFLATEAALLHDADPDTVLGDCGAELQERPQADFIRSGLAWLAPLGTPGAYTLELDAPGALRSPGYEPLEQVLRRVDHASARGQATTWDAVLVRPGRKTLERALVVRILPADQISKKHRLSRHLSGNEVYVIAYGELPEPVTALRDEWHLLSAAPVSRSTCKALASSRSDRWRLVPEGSTAVLFAQRDLAAETDDRQPVQVLRVVHAAEDPC